jgi:WD repeat-containing protein 45
VYNFTDLQLLYQIKTCSNPAGLCALSPFANTVLACPSENIGHVRVKLFDMGNKELEIPAHNGMLSQICLSTDGKLLATTSEKGTLIRIFDTATGDRLREFRRGADRAEIYSLAFSPNSKYVCCSSDKGTIHVFSLDRETQAEVDNRNQKSSLSFMKGMLPSYFSSEWSFVQAHLGKEGCKSICCFGQDSKSLIVLCNDGSYFKYTFDEAKGGEATLESEPNESFLRNSQVV